MPERVSIHYTDFSGGDWGDTDPLQVSVSEKQFSAQNMLVYDSGLIGPRCGFFTPTLSGWPSWAGGRVRAHAVMIPGSVPHGFVLHDKNLYRYTPGLAVSPTTYAAYASAAGYNASMTKDDSGNVFVADPSNGMFFHPDGGATTTAVAVGAGAGWRLVRWRDRMVFVDGSSSQSNRIYYSDANNFTSWPAANYYAIGPSGSTLVALIPFGDSLYAASNDGWYVLTGSLGSSISISEALVGRLPVGDAGGFAAAAISTGMPFVERASGACQIFTGATILERPHHRLYGYGTDYPTIHTGANDEIVYNAAGKLWFVDANGVITRHDMTPTSAGGYIFQMFAGSQAIEQVAATLSTVGSSASLLWAGAMKADASLLGVMAWPYHRNRPGYTGSGQIEAPCETTDTGTYLYLPPFWHPERGQSGNRLLLIPDGAMLRVRAVVVHWVGWNVLAGNIGFRVYARALGLDGSATDYVDSTVQTVSQSAGGFAGGDLSGGTERSDVFYMGDQGFGRGFQVRFDSLVGVAIRSVEAIVDIRDRRVS